MKIWLDVANSPQVLFFRPILPELKRQGHSVTITSRHFAQTAPLADQVGWVHMPIGSHGSKKLSSIGLTLLERAWLLFTFARSQHFDLAISHNSYAQAMAAFALRIPIITLMDYEHQPANHLCFRFARRVIVPECFPEWALRKYGAPPRKTAVYHGVKEQAYLTDFVPQDNYLASIGIPEEQVLVVMRPPGEWGLYHNFKNELFEQAVTYIARHEKALIVFLPRIASQADSIRERGYHNIRLLPKVADGPNLLYHADVVVSGGGTMNREAAVLGTPTYSVFKGKLAAVDRYLMDRGRMHHIETGANILTMRIQKKSRRVGAMTGQSIVGEITEAILGVI